MSHLLKQLAKGEFGIRCPNIEIYYPEFPDTVVRGPGRLYQDFRRNLVFELYSAGDWFPEKQSRDRIANVYTIDQLPRFEAQEYGGPRWHGVASPPQPQTGLSGKFFTEAAVDMLWKMSGSPVRAPSLEFYVPGDLEFPYDVFTETTSVRAGFILHTQSSRDFFDLKCDQFELTVTNHGDCTAVRFISEKFLDFSIDKEVSISDLRKIESVVKKIAAALSFVSAKAFSAPVWQYQGRGVDLIYANNGFVPVASPMLPPFRYYGLFRSDKFRDILSSCLAYLLSSSKEADVFFTSFFNLIATAIGPRPYYIFALLSSIGSLIGTGQKSEERIKLVKDLTELISKSDLKSPLMPQFMGFLGSFQRMSAKESLRELCNTEEMYKRLCAILAKDRVPVAHGNISGTATFEEEILLFELYYKIALKRIGFAGEFIYHGE
jgi:hypothetical protein